MKNRKGFTLIELLIVVVIIGILAAIAIPKFANTKEKAVVASMKSDLRNLVTTQEAFFSDNQDYAGTLGLTQTNGTTDLKVELDIAEDHAEFFNDAFPKALQKVKEIAER